MNDLLRFIDSRKDFLFQFLLNIFLTVVIFLNAEGGRLMGMTGGPLHISPVWPATGVSLAALLVFGFRVWPAVFFGNFCYNTTHFLAQSDEAFFSILAGFSVSIGSLLQALIGNWAVRRFLHKGFFKSVKDMVVFLIGGGAISCFVASTIGTITLYVYGALPLERFYEFWLTFWLGDCLGVYMITPFLVVWSLYKPIGRVVGQSLLETILMVISFFFITWAGFIATYPVGDLFIIFSIWVAYRSSLHGTVFWILFMSFAATIPTSLGYGSVVAYFGTFTWFALVVFLQIMIAMALVVSGIITELESALSLLRTKNRDLEKNLDICKRALKNSKDIF